MPSPGCSTRLAEGARRDPDHRTAHGQGSEQHSFRPSNSRSKHVLIILLKKTACLKSPDIADSHSHHSSPGLHLGNECEPFLHCVVGKAHMTAIFVLNELVIDAGGRQSLIQIHCLLEWHDPVVFRMK